MTLVVRADAIYLISESPITHGFFDTPTYSEKMVYCTVSSVTMSEWYRAHEQGLDPSIVFVLSDYSDYDGEKLIRWGNRYFRVIRTYINGLKIEITCEEANHAVTDA